MDFVNGKQHIATLAAKANLSLEITIERGKGYLGSDRDAGRKTIGVIPVDALFSPVRRVSFEVEPTRVAQSTNYDNLVLDIETDGSITPADALASAGARCAACSISWRRSPTSRSPSNWANRDHGQRLSRARHADRRPHAFAASVQLLEACADQLDRRPRRAHRGRTHQPANFGAQSIAEVKGKLDERGLALRV